MDLYGGQDSGLREFSSPLEALKDVSDVELRGGILHLFETARTLGDVGDVDLVVLSARRLACLYQLVVNAGFEPISSVPVVSDRYFDVGRDWTGKRILILDDSVVVGTTLFRLTESARALVGPTGSVSCAAVCVDEEQRADYLLDAIEFKALNVRASKAVDRFATDVVTALFRNGIPFFSDFPATYAFTVEESAWGDCLAVNRWHVADVTAPLIPDEPRSAYVHVPTTKSIEAALRVLPASVESLVESFKVRSYAAKFQPSDTITEPYVRVRLVPIALVRPSSEDALDRALRDIATQTRSDWLASAVERLEGEGKHRLLQMLVATQVLAHVLSEKAFHRAFSMSSVEALDSLPLGLYFAADAEAFSECANRLTQVSASRVRRRPAVDVRFDRPTPSPLLADNQLDEVLWLQREIVAAHGVVPEEPQAGALTKVGLIFFHSIASVFGYIDQRFEKPQRQQIRQLDSISAYRKHYASSEVRVLDQGLTLRELTESLAPESLNGPPWLRSIVSLGIDIGNDLGIIVPATQKDPRSGLIYRCYRLGETAHLAARPLFEAAWTQQWDELTRRVEQGFPIMSTTADLKVAFTSPKELSFTLDPSALKNLREAVIRVVPSMTVQGRFAGTVTHVEADHFQADIVREPGGDAGYGSFQVNQVAAEQRHSLREGIEFFWTLYASEGNGEPQSRIRLVLRRPFDRAVIRRDVAKLAQRGGTE
ncbi:hypothetical protein ACVW00_000045 [Marmoricola sp. URHA0025 HA25]